MPNWCSNRLEVAGPSDAIKAFRDAVILGPDKEIRILATLLPLPEGSTKKVGDNSVFTDEGWDTAHKLWGTKWGDCDTELWSDEPEYLEFGMNSAWGPPLNGFTNVSKMFPDLTFTLWYNEPDNCFRGKGIVKNGEIISDQYDDNFQLSPKILEKAGITEEKQEQIHEIFWDYYGDFVYDFGMTSDKITEFVIDKFKEEVAR